MNDLNIEHSLIHYAHSVATSELSPFAKGEPRFNDIIDDLAHLDTHSDSQSITPEQADTYLVMPPSDPDVDIPDQLTPNTVTQLQKLARKILDVLATMEVADPQPHKALQHLCRALWPLYSRHSATNMIGFDLQEYADYFETITPDEKSALVSRLRADWDN
jgi:hypothetical protein